QAHAFIRGEEEGAVARERAAEAAAEVVLADGGALKAAAVGEPVVGVERVVAEVLEGRAVQLVRPRARGDGDLRAGRAPELRRVRRGEQAELFERVERDEVVGAAEHGERRQAPGGGLTGRSAR